MVLKNCAWGKLEVGILQPKMTLRQSKYTVPVAEWPLWLPPWTSPFAPDHTVCLGVQTRPHGDPAVESAHEFSYLCKPCPVLADCTRISVLTLKLPAVLSRKVFKIDLLQFYRSLEMVQSSSGVCPPPDMVPLVSSRPCYLP